MNVAPPLSPREGASPAAVGTRRWSRRALLLLAAGVLSLLTSMLLAATAVMLMLASAPSDEDFAMSLTATIVLLLLALFTAGLGWLGLRRGRERLASRRRIYYPGF